MSCLGATYLILTGFDRTSTTRLEQSCERFDAHVSSARAASFRAARLQLNDQRRNSEPRKPIRPLQKDGRHRVQIIIRWIKHLNNSVRGEEGVRAESPRNQTKRMCRLEFSQKPIRQPNCATPSPRYIPPKP